MSNLLKYEWYELRHNLIFWLTMVIPCALGIIMFGPDYLGNDPLVPDIPHNIQGIFMATAADGIIPLLIITGAFTAMLFGQQFSNRVIDHEIAAGHSRIAIYTSRCIVGFIVPNVAILLALLLGCIRCSFSIPLPSTQSIPYFIRTIAMLLLLNFSLISICIFLVMLFRDTAKSMAISALFLLIICWFMAGLLQTANLAPGTAYTNTPGLALLFHQAYLIRHVLRPHLTLVEGLEAIAVTVGWITVFLGGGYCVFRRCELK